MQVLLQYRLIIFTNIAREKRRLHHLQCRFLKFSGGGPPDPPSEVSSLRSVAPHLSLQNFLSGLTYMYAIGHKPILSDQRTCFHIHLPLATPLECVSGLSVYWPIIALGTRECGVAKLCRDPTVQSEFFLRVSLLKTFN